MFNLNTLKLLRIPFSFFLMPVFLFALSQSYIWDFKNIWLVFIVLHVFIYPASNAYNSYMDKDEGSIGGLRNPPKVTKNIFYASILFDVMGFALSLLVSTTFFMHIFVYMLASRAYSYKGIRLKKYAILGFLTVVFFQGYFTFYICYDAFGNRFNSSPYFGYAAVACLFLIGGVYPLTQIYQHQEDAKNGDKTISILLGYKGTFILTAIMFTTASVLLFMYFDGMQKLNHFYILQAFLFPVVVYFIWWFLKVIKDNSKADFDHTMRMNFLASASMNVCFIVLTILNYLS